MDRCRSETSFPHETRLRRVASVNREFGKEKGKE